jgi:hypothetical protein
VRRRARPSLHLFLDPRRLASPGGRAAFHLRNPAISSPKAAPGAAASNPIASLAALLSPARAAASRRNGEKSRGPKTPEGKARASRNALKHGLRAEKHVLVAGESAEAFAAFEAALVADLAPQGALQTLLAGRIARAAWRLERAERLAAGTGLGPVPASAPATRPIEPETRRIPGEPTPAIMAPAPAAACYRKTQLP